MWLILSLTLILGLYYFLRVILLRLLCWVFKKPLLSVLNVSYVSWTERLPCGWPWGFMNTWWCSMTWQMLACVSVMRELCYSMNWSTGWELLTLMASRRCLEVTGDQCCCDFWCLHTKAEKCQFHLLTLCFLGFVFPRAFTSLRHCFSNDLLCHCLSLLNWMLPHSSGHSTPRCLFV